MHNQKGAIQNSPAIRCMSTCMGPDLGHCCLPSVHRCPDLSLSQVGGKATSEVCRSLATYAGMRTIDSVALA